MAFKMEDEIEHELTRSRLGGLIRGATLVYPLDMFCGLGRHEVKTS